MTVGKVWLCLGIGVSLSGCESILEDTFPAIFSDVIARERPFGGWELELEAPLEEGGGRSYKVERKMETRAEELCPAGYHKIFETVDPLPFDPPADRVTWEIQCHDQAVGNK